MRAAAYRRTGADPPFGDPRRDHGVAMEGYYWRLTDPAASRVVMVLCGVCVAPDGRWAIVALATEPEGVLETRIVPTAWADPRALGVRAAGVLFGDEGRLRVDLGDAALDVRFRDRVGWPRRALGGLGVAHALPGLSQYWHPHLLAARVTGDLRLGDRRIALDGATAYAEKNWGADFAGAWWWGQAQGFPDDPQACVAFAGGPLALLGRTVPATAVVARVGDEVLRFGAPASRVVTGGDGWRVSARSPRHAIEVEGEQAGARAFALPVPIPEERRVVPRSRQILAGRLALTIRRGRRTLFRGESSLAGLERG
jgi:Tocopherol cyclase